MKKNFQLLWSGLAVAALILLIIGTGIKNGSPEDYQANLGYFQVVKVIDGDTILLDNGQQVRYIGIDAPELGQPWAREASDFNSQLVSGGWVRLERDIRYLDKYGRILAYVYIPLASGEEIMANQELLKAGWAKTLNILPDVKYQPQFYLAETQAAAEQKGIWQ